MNETLGARLRRERERRKISLAAMAASTKIKASSFEALEREDASHFPPPGIFRRSFVRAYATSVGLDADEVVRDFLERFPDPIGAPISPASVAPPDQTPAVPAGAGTGHQHAGLRLTLADTRRPFTGGRRLLADTKRRWTAAALDGGLLVAVGLICFAVIGAFWKPLGVTALCYYLTSILVLGNTPGVCLFAPRETDDDAAGPPQESDSTENRAPHLHPEFRVSI